MKYTPLAEYPQAWIFRHRDMPVNAEALAQIQPLTEESAQQFWKTHISQDATHASHFSGEDWPTHNGIWHEKDQWQTAWESDETDLPELLAQHCQWDNNTPVFFCYNHTQVIQTQWSIARQYWKNFLFYDDGVFLLGKRRQEVVRFDSDGSFQIGIKKSKQKS